MSLETKSALIELDGQPLPHHLLENFEKADARLRELYGFSPGVPALVRLWLACGTSSLIREEFEQAVMDLKQSPFPPEGRFDVDRL